MAGKFIDLKVIDGSRMIVNKAYITQVTPTHGTEFADGADVVLLVFGEEGAVQVPVPASAVPNLIAALNLDSPESLFLELRVLNGSRIILNRDYITHVCPTHGTDLNNGATVTVWGFDIEIGAREIPSLLPLLS
jgi:hypothetical protein